MKSEESASVKNVANPTPEGEAGRKRRRRPRILFYLAFLGPGLVAANAGNDAGGVATYSQMGAQYGFDLLWVMVLVGFGVAIVQEMCARMGAATGKGLSDLIRENFSIRITFLVMLALLIANAAIVISEFVGIAAAMQIFGVPAWISAPTAGVLIWLLIARGSYARVEKVFLVMTFAFFAYIVSAVLDQPDWGQVAYHTVVPTIKFEGAFITTLMAAIGTTISPYMQLYVQSSVVEKGVTMRDYKFARIDVFAGSAFSILVAYFIIIATGSTIFKATGGQAIQTAGEAAQALRPLLGDYATYVFAAGLLGASLLAAGVLPLATSYSITEALGFENGVNTKFGEAPVFWGLFTGLIGLGVVIAVIPGLPAFQLLVISQLLNGLILPFILIAILSLINNKELMGQYTNSRLYNVFAWIIAISVSGLSLILISNTLLGIFGWGFF